MPVLFYIGDLQAFNLGMAVHLFMNNNSDQPSVQHLVEYHVLRSYSTYFIPFLYFLCLPFLVFILLGFALIPLSVSIIVLALWIMYYAFLNDHRVLFIEAYEKLMFIEGFGMQMTTLCPPSFPLFLLYLLTLRLPKSATTRSSSHLHNDYAVFIDSQIWQVKNNRFFPLSETTLPFVTEALDCFQARYFLHVAIKANGKLCPLFQVSFNCVCLVVFHYSGF